MTTATPSQVSSLSVVPRRPRVTWVYCLAAVGLLMLCLQGVVWFSWLATGPVSVHRYRDTSDVSWTLALIYQGVAVALLLVLGVVVIRRCVRERRLTFDATFCVAGLATLWLDPVSNYLLPTYTYSAQWINLNDWLGQVPGVRNPDGGRLGEPLVLLAPMYTVGWLAFAMGINAAMRWLRRARPSMPEWAVLAVAISCAVVVDILFELPMFACNLWSNQATPRIGFFASSGRLYPVTEMLIACVCFGTLAALRYYRDDRGATVLERPISRLRPRVKALIATLAMIGFMNLLWLVMITAWTVVGLYSAPWQQMKPWVTNGVCDAPGVTGTRYGPCPGSPGFRLPLSGSLPGQSPGGHDDYLNGPTQCDGCKDVVVQGDPNAHRR